MNSLKEKIAESVALVFIISLGVGLGMFGFAGIGASGPVDESLGVGYNVIETATTTNRLITTTSQLLTATSTNRTWLRISNNGTNPVWLGFGGENARVGYGIPLGPASTTDSYFEMNSDNLYYGPIKAISAGGSNTVTVTGEFNNEN